MAPNFVAPTSQMFSDREVGVSFLGEGEICRYRFKLQSTSCSLPLVNGGSFSLRYKTLYVDLLSEMRLLRGLNCLRSAAPQFAGWY